MRLFHKIQAVSLLVAGVLLWYSPGLTHTGAMGIVTGIIGVNALVEWFTR